MSYLSPDCRDANHQKCDGVAWDDEDDEPTGCGCLKCHGNIEPIKCLWCGRERGCNADCEDMNCDHCYCHREGRDG